MKDAVAEFLRREAEANRTPRHADYAAILRAVAAEYAVPRADLWRAILDATVAGPV